MSANSVIYTENPSESIRNVVNELNPDRCFILTDSNVRGYLERLLTDDFNPCVIELAPGEESKSIETVLKIIDALIDGGATRRSLLINFGGGVVSDTGGFAASIFKRGIKYVNVPTTVLSAADAAIGGKTGVDYRGLKNEIGVFAKPQRVIICPSWFKTLGRDELLSGFGEIVKMALITSPEIYGELVSKDALTDEALFEVALLNASRQKERIVSLDPTEKGLRRILNFGHTAGHAFEMSAAMKGKPVPHGAAVAYGILVALWLSEIYCSLDSDVAKEFKCGILDRYYDRLPLDRGDIEELLRIMSHDKKNSKHGVPSFVLLEQPGKPVEAFEPAPDVLRGVLERYFDSIH
ncbi:MAG: 3-dehydroquinate synthase [Bacteroidales bacterium]|nr:3-dehydroquinate synthase [Bacteroidales bacterium]MBD5222942.1 3-dehydroquinate synthase [Bacteroidales bacterium]MBD5301551.1 3-dehydroquinate synthase [Bacteroides sp.]